jgi:Mrp family chromosome partitioning ATPase
VSSYFEALNRRSRRPGAAPAPRAPGAPAPRGPASAPAAPEAEAPAQPAAPEAAEPARVRFPPRPPEAPAPQPLRPAAPPRQPPPSALAPTYATLRERLALAAEGKPLKTLVFAGCDGGEGCSRLVREFGESLAASGLDVLVVDADLRGARAGAGADPAAADFAALVRQQALPPDAEGAQGTLTVVPGASSSDPESFLRSKELAAWLDGARTRFHYTLLDCAPLLRQADGVLAGALCDGVVIVARGGVTPGASLSRARQLVERAGGRVVGVVLTDFHNPIPSLLRRFLDRE